MVRDVEKCPNPAVKFDDGGLSIRAVYSSYRSGGKDNLRAADIRAFRSHTVKDLAPIFSFEDQASFRKFEEAIRQQGHKGFLVLQCGAEDICYPKVVHVRYDAGKGIGTKLYEVAAKLACLFAKRLRSDQLRSPYSESFWRKQVAKGRAFCAKKNVAKIGNAMVGSGVMLDPNDWSIDKNQDFKPGNPRIPKPVKGSRGGFYWPCLIYELKTPFPETLKGLRKGRSRSGKRRRS